MTPDFNNSRQIFALTLYGEIRGGDQRAKEHVASVILNRVRHPRWWGKTIAGVCLARLQFSCWWEGGANHAAMLAVNERDPAYQGCLAVVDRSMKGIIGDRTLGADSYFATGTPTPNWAPRAKFTIADGFHSFYKTIDADVPHAGEPGAPTVSIHAEDSRADDLNALELERITRFKHLTKQE